MADLHLRFHHDMLVLSGSPAPTLARGGYDMEAGLELLCLTEEEAVEQALRLQLAAGAQCLVTPTWGITGARLAHERMRDHQREAAAAALRLACGLAPQHVVAQVGTTGLPLDPGSAQSLKANRDQYADAVRAFGDEGVDAFLLDGFANAADLRCALMGAAKATARPVLASVDVDGRGLLADGTPAEEAAAVMADLGASAAGVRTGAGPDAAAGVVARVAAATDLPVLVQLRVTEPAPRQREATDACPYWHPDVLFDAAARLRAAGAQFLRAAGAATPTFTGALVAATLGQDCVR